MKNKIEHQEFRASQKALIFKDEKVLILECKKYPGEWDLPGGRINSGEDAEKSFKREMEEEICISEFVVKGIASVNFIYKTKKNIPTCVILYIINVDNNKIALGNEHSAMKWISEDELGNYNFLWPGAREDIRKGFAVNKKLSK